MDMGLRGKVALITGANNPQGIGAATALALAREGARLVLVYKRVARDYDEGKTGENGIDRYHKANGGDASAVEARLRAHGAEPLIIEGDITDPGQVRSIFDRAAERFGTVDILINNAAHSDDFDTIETITDDAIRVTVDVNIRGALLMIREFIIRRGTYGRIVNLSTDSAQVFPGQIAYGASKAAIEAFTRSVAIEVGQYGITVNCVAPGPTQTGWLSEAAEIAILPDIPLGRLVTPEDVADAIVFLASERSGMTTGQVVKVSGGHAL